MRVIMWIGLVWLAAVSTAPAQRLTQPLGTKPPLGSRVRLNLTGERNLNGELLAVDHDSVWLLQKHELASVPLGDVSEVRVDRGGMGAKGALLWSLTFGIVSGVALQTACESVSDDCNILPVSLGLWAIIGAASAASLQSTRQTTVPPEPTSLRLWARFPQGLPAAFARDSLAPPRNDNQ